MSLATPRAQSASAVLLLALLSGRTARAQDKAQCVAAYDAGQARRDEGKLIDARVELSRCASSSCPAVLRRDCITWLRAVEARIPTIVVRAVDGGDADVSDAMLAIDARSPAPVDGRPVSVDPGPHRLNITAGTTSTSRDIVVAEGEQGPIVVVKVAPASTPPPPPPPARPPPPLAAPTPAQETKPRSPEARPVPAWLYVLGGAGVALVGAGTFFYVSGFTDGGSLEDTCGSPPSCPRSETDAAHTKLIVGDVLVGVGAVALGVATYLFVTRPTKPSQALLHPLRGPTLRF